MNIKAKINTARAESTNRAETILNQVKAWQIHYQSRLAVLETAAQVLEPALKKLGLEIVEFNFGETHRVSDIPQWTDDSRIRVSVCAVPVGGQFRFLTFQGYDAHGCGKNAARLANKARTMQERIAAACGLNVSINPYSLELQGGQDTKRILIDFAV